MASSVWYLTLETGERSVEAVEQEVRDALDGADDAEAQSISEHRGNVAVRGVEMRDLPDIDVPRIAETDWGESTGEGGVRLYRRLDDRFAKIDSAGSYFVSSHFIDYCGINYGLAPKYARDHFGGGEPSVTDDSQRASDQTEPVSAAQVQHWLENPAAVDRETLVPALDSDRYCRLIGRILVKRGDIEFEAAASRLDDDDPTVRARAAREIAMVGNISRHWRDNASPAEIYEQFLAALDTVDERTRAVVAPALWDPAPLERDEQVPASVLGELASLADDDVPELRAGALVGAAAVLSDIHHATKQGEFVPGREFREAVQAFFDAHERAVTDDDPRVRKRAARLLWEDLHDTGNAVSDCWCQVDFEQRWRVTQRAADTVNDETLVSALTEMAMQAEQMTTRAESTAETLVEYVYEDPGEYHEEVRQELPALAEKNPEAMLVALDPVLDIVERGEETDTELELLAELASEAPERVARVAPRLEAVLDEEDSDRRHAASRALNQLPDDARSVALAELVEATSDVFNEHGKVSEDRIRALTETSPEESIDLLAEMAERIASNEQARVGTSTARALRAANGVDTGIVAEALPELAGVWKDLERVNARALIPLVATAREHPNAVVEHGETLGVLLAHPKGSVREAAATVLVTAGDQLEGLPTPFDALLPRADDACYLDSQKGWYSQQYKPYEWSNQTPPDWPLGVVAATDTGFVVDAATTTAAVGNAGSRRSVMELVHEVAAGERDAAVAILDEWVTRTAEMPGPDSVERLAAYLKPVVGGSSTDQEGVALLTEVVDGLAATLANVETGQEGLSDAYHRPEDLVPLVETALSETAATAPAATREAIEAHYGSLTTFYETDPDVDVSYWDADSRRERFADSPLAEE